MLNGLRWLLTVLGFLAMAYTLTIKPFDRGQFTIPLGLAVGLLYTRWYASLSHSQLQHFWQRVEPWLRWPKSALMPVAITLILALLPSLIRGHFPYPGNHDELSYHLAADTYLHGRWANPTPPGWEHFESYHINLQPSYCSKYQPGMGLMLAIGQAVGHTYVVVLLALCLASVALNWMFHQWLAPRWVAIASLLACFPLCGNWSDCYFVGGPLATCAGAWLLGQARCLMHRLIRWYDGITLAACLVLLFWTRPFEGGIVAVCIGLPLLYRIITKQGWWVLVWPLVPSSLLILVPAVWCQGQLNYACTGSYTTLPYLEHERQYGRTPLFLFQKERDDVPIYRHDSIRLFNQQMIDWYHMQRTPTQLPHVLAFKFGVLWSYFYGLLWLFPLAAGVELVRFRSSRWLLWIWCLLLLALLSVCWLLHHYVAPAFPAWSLIVILSMQSVRRWRWRAYPLGRWLVILLAASFMVQIVFERTMAGLYSGKSWTNQRRQLLDELETQGGRHLVLLRYGAQHDTGQEWVYNLAELQQQSVVWARSMGAQKDQELCRLYPDRTCWLLHVDSQQEKLVPQLERYVP